MKNALRINKHAPGFPHELSPRTIRSGSPRPAVDFSEKIEGDSVGDALNNVQDIYVSPTGFFFTQFWKVFDKTQITFRTAKYSRKWLSSPQMSFWRQQLNFALWCATTGCGVPREILSESGLNLPNQPNQSNR